jgi:hypothetical protein
MFIPRWVLRYSALPLRTVWSMAKPLVLAMNMLKMCDPETACS